jgi:predicted MPP superfamily phosphohydrolase
MVSYFLSAIFLRFSSNPITNAFAWISSLWMGLWLHLLAVLALFWLTYGMTRTYTIARGKRNAPNKRTVFSMLLGLAVVATAYGTVNAFSVPVKRIDIQLADLPDHWRGKTVVQISDVHLGSIRGLRFLRGVIDKVNGLEPELIFITGDLFDGMGANLQSFTEPLRKLAASRDVFFVTGNHEGYLGLTEPLSIVEHVGIRTLDDEVVELEGLQIAGVSFPEFASLNKARSVARMGEAIDPTKPCILLYHTPTDVAESMSGRAEQQTNTYLEPDIDFSFAREFRVDLQLSGHTHEGQIFPFTYLTKWIFGGYHYGLHEFDGFSLYITSGTGTWGPPLRTGSKSEIVAITLR